MEDIYDRLRLPEDLRKEYRNVLIGMTPAIIVNMGVSESIDKMRKLKIPIYTATGIAYACVVYEKSKPYLNSFNSLMNFQILKCVLFVNRFTKTL